MKGRLLNERIIAAAKECVIRSWPFAVVYPPECTEALFYASEKTLKTASLSDRHNCFILSTFGLGESQSPVGIPARYNPDDILSGDNGATDCSEIEPLKISYERTTSFTEYDGIIRSVTEELAGKTGKTVISRLIVEQSDSDPFDVADRYFRQFPKCFRTIYFTPEVGLWIVATPEVLLDYDYERKLLKTMSLAGTRIVGGPSWDEKNLKEHELVTRYIVETLEATGMKVNVSESENLPFGTIEHLCNKIEAEGMVRPIDVALRLSPTPAVCGWPKEKAFGTIVASERHKRSCYGAFIGVSDESSCRLYVNLRCCKVEKLSDSDEYRYLLIAGGGINEMSETSAEWEEGANKIRPLHDAVKLKEKELNVG